MTRRLITLAAVTAVTIAGARNLSAQQANALILRNNHELSYRGPLDLVAALPDGHYAGPGGDADIRGGRAHVFAALAPKQEITLARTGAPSTRPFANGPLGVTHTGERLELRWNAHALADVALGLVVLPGTSSNVDDAVRAFAPLSLKWTSQADGSLSATIEQAGFVVIATARPYGAGWLDVRTSVVNRNAATTPAYVALVRRVVAADSRDARLRFNGREMAVGSSPAVWDRDFWYVHGVDWMSWKSGTTSLLSVNGFTPVPSVKHDSTWGEGSSFYVRERTRQAADTTFLVAEIAGPNPDQPKGKGYMAVVPYAVPGAGDTVALKWRLAVADAPEPTWPESQLRAFAGARLVSRAGSAVRADIGVPYTTFGMSYFPYSTFSENFDFYRVPGLTSENFWPTSPVMWKQWRQWMPRMRSDMHIIRSMGFDILRLHHLELLQTLPRAEALAFLDFYADQARALGFKLMIDTEGPAEWVSTIAGRYKDVIVRVELENEVLIPGITPAEPARWKALYAAAKQAAPDADVFFTSAGNNSMFERLQTLGVPFDRVGLHAYKHGPQWKEAYASHMLGTGGYATELGKAMTLGEYNWKDLTRLAPEVRHGEFAEIYRQVLSSRSVPEVIQFQFQEQIAFNTTVGGTSSRHYEPVGIDRRPKAEAFEAMKLMREYGRPDAPARVLPVTIEPVRFADGNASATFTVTNNTGHAQAITLEALAFDGATTRLLTPATMQIAAGATGSGRVSLSLPGDARPGAYHHFVSVRYDASRSMGWGVASNEGAPQFADTSVLGTRVTYAQGAAVVKTIRWDRPLAVVFGEKSSALELEEAFQLANTLQSATGRAVRVSTEKDLPDSLARGGTVFVVGTAATSMMVSATHTPITAPGVGVISAHRDGHEWIVLTGADAKGVEAAVAELVLRFWPNAKDATIRITGIEPGKALGHSAGGSTIDPP